MDGHNSMLDSKMYNGSIISIKNMYKIVMRTGRDNKISYTIQQEFKVFGVTKWKNIQSFSDYDSASNFLNRILCG